MPSRRVVVGSAFVSLFAFAPRVWAQSAASTAWVEGGVDISASRAPSRYISGTSPSGRIAVAIPVAGHALVAFQAEKAWSAPRDLACLTYPGGTPCEGRGFSLSGLAALAVADRPPRLSWATLGVGLGAYRLHGDWASTASVIGVPLRVEAPFLTSGPMSIQVAWHAVVIPRVDKTSVLSFGMGLALRARPFHQIRKRSALRPR